jgi:transposase
LSRRENVTLEGLNKNIGVIQRRAYGLRGEEYLRLKIRSLHSKMTQSHPH